MPEPLFPTPASLTRRRGFLLDRPPDAHGRLDEQVAKTFDWARRFCKRETRSAPQCPAFPVDGLREAVVNTTAHRDYSMTTSPILVDVFADRVEVTSPGTLPGRMTLEMLRRGGVIRSWNETIAHYALCLGLTERRARGWLGIEDAMREWGGATPRIEANHERRWVRVTLDLSSATGS